MREFNTTGLCVPRKHYMVDVSSRVEQMCAMVYAGKYFCVNRPRQYGKTTLLAALRNALAADFDVDMSFSVKDVAGMLREYEADHATGMDVTAVAREICNWTGGYPFLVSRVCQLVDGRHLGWDHAGVNEAVRLLLAQGNALFESLVGKLDAYPGLKTVLRAILMDGRSFAYNPDQEEIVQLTMYGFVTDRGGRLVVANRIFETRLYNLFLSEKEPGLKRVPIGDKVLWEETV